MMFGFEKDGPELAQTRKTQRPRSENHLVPPPARSGRFKDVRKYLLSVISRVAALRDFYQCADQTLEKEIHGEDRIADPKVRWSREDTEEAQDLKQTQGEVKQQTVNLERALRQRQAVLTKFLNRSGGEACAAANQLAHQANTSYERLAARAKVSLIPYRESRGGGPSQKVRSFFQKAALATALCHALAGGAVKGVEATAALQTFYARASAPLTTLIESAPPAYNLQYLGYGKSIYERKASTDLTLEERADIASKGFEALDKAIGVAKQAAERTSAKVKGSLAVKMESTFAGNMIRYDFAAFERTNVFEYGGFDVAYT